MKKKLIFLLFLSLMIFGCNSALAKQTVAYDSIANDSETSSLESSNLESMPKESVEEKLNRLLEMQQKAEEFQSKLSGEIDSLKGRLEYQQTALNDNSVSVEKLKTSVDKQNDKLKFTDKVKVYGYAETGFRIYNNAPRNGNYVGSGLREDSSTFQARHLAIFPQVNLNDKLWWQGKINFVDGGNAGTLVSGSEFRYKVFGDDRMVARAGLLLPLEFNPTSVAPHSFQRDLVDYSLLDTYLVPHYIQDVGIGLMGTLPIADTDMKIRYQANLINGFRDTLVPTTGYIPGTPLAANLGFNGLIGAHPKLGGTAGRTNLRDNNANKTFMGRVAFAPCKYLEFGTSYMGGALDTEGANYMNFLGADMKLKYKRLNGLLEYANVIFTRNSILNSQGVSFKYFPTQMNGWYGELGYQLTDKVKVIGGYGTVDLDESLSGVGINRGSIGLKYEPYKNVFLKTEYQMTTGRKRFGTEPFSNAFLTELTVKLQ